ncbi:MAG TPA: ATP-binding protein [Gaiellaceae bacterium]|nr:ATP-binding protein [Gaiellaceae bacterium]
MGCFVRFYAAAGVALAVAAAWTAPDPRWDAVPWAGACLLGATAVAVGLRRHRPRHRRFWLGIGAANALWALGAVAQLAGAYDVASNAFGDGDILYQPGYLGLAVAVLMLLRTTRGVRPEPLDAVIGATVAVALLWPVAVRLFHAAGAAAATFGTLNAVWDVALSLLLIRLALSPWARLRSLQLITAGVVALTAADVAYASLLFRSPLAGRVLSVAYTLVYLLLGAAALHPSMRRLPPREIRDHVRSNRRLLLILGVALAATPLSFGISEALGGDATGFALAALALVVVALVVVRIARLLRRLNELRVRAEESERLFRLVFDAAGIGISVGTDGLMSRTNAALHRILGYSAEELGGSHFTRFVHPEDRAGVHTPIPGEVTTFERRYVRKDGETVWAEVTLTAPDDGSFGIAVIDDVTLAKRLEQDLRHAQKMEAVGQLAGGVAHDFNNLMMAVSGYAGLLQRELDRDDPRRERVHAIAAAAERATELTRKLLAFSRRQVLRLSPADVAGVVAELEPILRGVLPETIVLDLDLQPGGVARIDRGELEQALLNLTLNARDAMEDGGLLQIRVRHDGAAVEIAVVDTGSGMDEETRLRSFDPFFTTKPVGKGTGLGLSTVDGIVAQLGGSIDVASELGRGTTCTIRLPLDPTGAVEPPAAPAEEAATDGAGRVLLVEDEEIVRLVTTEMLARSGYDVVAAASAEDALVLLAQGERPDVLVSDVIMTGLDGPSLVDRARAILPALPVLFVSGYPAESLRDRTEETILTKPFTPAELAEGIEQVRRATAVAA